jgi:hypothetical protein
MTPIDFIKNILTDTYKDKMALKVDALNVYTLLIQNNQEPAILTFNFDGQKFSIPTEYYNEAVRLYKAGQKINAIKTIRTHGWMGDDKTSTPELKFSKEFVESIFFH